MRLDTIIKNGKLVTAYDGIQEVNIGVKDGKVATILDRSTSIPADEEIDATGQHILPGVIETHVHLAAGHPIEQLMYTETASCAIGGITTVIDFRRPRPDSTFEEHFPYAVKVGEEKAFIDFAYHFIIHSQKHAQGIEHYIRDYGVSSFKMHYAYFGEEGKQMGMRNELTDGLLYEWFSQLAKFPNVVGMVHCENVEISTRLREKLKAEGRNDLRVWSESRPNFCESETVQKVLCIGHATGCPTYIVHTSTKEAVAAVNHYRAMGHKGYIETCPHYLTHTMDAPLGNLGKVNPPLRSKEDNEALWRGIIDGSVNTMGTDNCAMTVKDDKQGTIWDAIPGFPGSSTMLPVLLSEGVNKRGIPIEKIVRVTSYNTSRIFNLYPKKGTIQVGSDADIAMVDLNLEKVVKAQDLMSTGDYSIYDGWKLKGWPTMTMVRGKIVMRDGKIVGKSGYGQYQRRDVLPAGRK